ncbi:hypothetical protein ASE74_22655 [Pedobacter sp. Leaf216]|nr:hypothetical protein ASE74_22655 [Pedobacter sp. Leaf216]
MGTDKGLLCHQNKLWAQIAYDKLSTMNLSVQFSVNPLQQETYTDYFGKENLIVDHHFSDVKGPLLGVLSAHLSNPDEDLFLLACDMLMMETHLLQQLMQAFKTDDGFDAYVFSKDAQQEPLCGIYKAQGLKKIIELFNRRGLGRHSMKYVLSKLHVCEIAIADEDSHYFGNFNSKEEINDLK